MESNISIEYNYLLTKIYGPHLAWSLYKLIEICLMKYTLEQESKIDHISKNIESIQHLFYDCIHQINEWCFNTYKGTFTFPNLKETSTIKDCIHEIIFRLFEFFNANLQLNFVTSKEYECLTDFQCHPLRQSV